MLKHTIFTAPRPTKLKQLSAKHTTCGDDSAVLIELDLLRRRHRQRADVREKILQLAERRLQGAAK